MTFDPRAAMRRSIRHLKPYYRAPEEPLLRMDQNTNIIGRNPVIEEVGVDSLEFNQYPTRDADRLLAALGKRFELPTSCVLAANGSDEVLDIILKGFTDPGDVLATPQPSYSLYPFYAALHGLEHRQVPLGDDWALDVDGLLEGDPKVILVASPNNPTGNAFTRATLEDLVDRADGLVVVDEAYAEYSEKGSILPLVKTRKNLVVMRTFSKAYALAGARLGWLAAHPDTTAVLGLVKPPFNVNAFTEDLGVRALAETDFVEKSTSIVHAERPRMAKGLESLGFSLVTSDANFLLTFPPDGAPDGPALAGALRTRGIAARTFAHVPRLERSIRFTVGRREDNEELVAAIRDILKEGAE